MSKYDGKYAVMMDDDMEIWDDDWPVRYSDSTLEASRRRSSYAGNPTLLPKSDFSAQFIENKALRDAQGIRHDGGIYLLSDKH